MKIIHKPDDRDVKILAVEKLAQAQHFVVIAVDRRDSLSTASSDDPADAFALMERGLKQMRRFYPVRIKGVTRGKKKK